ncbi:hypothetical protein [Ferrimonas pelagia]|uniref:Uncharacterized protein n=1 Tax=Ferrimonas pelagia TaxID=1177826 RepID=A0ABP9EAU8_9GAMM
MNLYRISSLIRAKHTGSFAVVWPSWLLHIGVLAVVLIGLGWLSKSEFYQPTSLYGLLLLGSMGFWARHFFNEYRNPLQALRWHTLPASQAEKWLSQWIVSALAMPLLLFAWFWLASVLAALALSWFGSRTALAIFNPLEPSVWASLKTYWALHPILFFGLVYFDKSPVIKSLAAMLMVPLLWMLLGYQILTIFGGQWHLRDFMHTSGFEVLLGMKPTGGVVLGAQHPLVVFAHQDAWQRVQPVVILLYSLYFWGLSYLRFKELDL